MLRYFIPQSTPFFPENGTGDLRRHGSGEDGVSRIRSFSGYWPTADKDPSAPSVIVEYAQIWKPVSKVVFSSTLNSVDWNSRLVRGDAVAEVTRLKVHAGGSMGVGGLSLGIRWPHRRVPPLLCSDLFGFGQGSLLADQ